MNLNLFCIKQISHLLLTATLFCITQNSYASVTVGSSSQQSGGAGILNFNHQLTTGDNRTVVVGVSLEAKGYIARTANITYGGVTMHAIPNSFAFLKPGSTSISSELFYLIDTELPSTGGHAIQVAHNATNISVGAVLLKGVVQGSPEAVATNAVDSPSSLSTSINTLTADSLLLDVTSGGHPTDRALLQANSSQTSFWGHGASSSQGGGSTLQAGVAGNYSLQWNTSGMNRVAHSVAVFAPAAITAPVNQPPVFNATSDHSVQEGTTKTITLTATDADSDALSFSSVALPSYATLTDNGNSTATLTLAPLSGSTSTALIITVTDNTHTPVSQTVNITVTPDGPTGSLIPGSITLGASSQQAGGAGSINFSHALVAGSNRAVVVSVGIENKGDVGRVTAISYGGIAMHAIPNSFASIKPGSTSISTELFYLLDTELPASGSQSIAIAHNGKDITASALQINGVIQNTPQAVATNAIDAPSGIISTAITTLSENSLLIDIASGGHPADRAQLEAINAQVSLFQHGNFAGIAEVFTNDDEDLRDNPIGNDNVSSIKVPAGCAATLYQHVGYEGTAESFSTDDADFSGNTIENDDASSIKVACQTDYWSISASSSQGVGSTRQVGAVGSYTQRWNASGMNRTAHSIVAFAPASAPVTVPVSQPPVLNAISDQSVQEGSTKIITLTATDADGDALSFNSVALPDYATLTDNLDNTATLTLAPLSGDISATLVITVTDGTHTPVSQTVNITVIPDGLTEPLTPSSITLGASSQQAGGAGSINFSHALVAGSNRAVVVSVGIENKGDVGRVTAISYGGIAMHAIPNSFASIKPGSTSISTELFYLLDTELPASGSQSIAIAHNGKDITASALQINGVIQNTPQAVATNAIDAPSGIISTAITTLSENSLLIDIASGGHPADRAQLEAINAQVSLFQHGNFAGIAEVFINDDEDLRDNPIGNDNVSSIKVPAGCAATLYQHVGYEGTAESFSTDDADFSGNTIENDDASSIKVACQTDYWSISASSSQGVGSTRQVGAVGSYTQRWNASGMNRTAHSIVAFAPALISASTNQPPSLNAISDQSVEEGSTKAITLTATDADGDTVTFTSVDMPDYASLTDNHNNTATLTLAPQAGDVGSKTMMVRVSDSINSPVERAFSIAITIAESTNQAPVLNSIGHQTLQEGGNKVITLTATDTDDDSITFSAVSLPSYATLISHQNNTATLTLAPQAGDVGTTVVAIIATDTSHVASQEIINITVNPAVLDNYGFTPLLTQAELTTTSSCTQSSCGQSAMDAGAVYYVIKTTVDHGKVIAFYDAQGRQLGVTILGTASSPDSTGTSTTQTFTVASDDSTTDPVGYLTADFAVSASGAATYNVPIAIPPGSAGVAPEISLNYNSQGGEGIAGLGWSISGFSAISRCPKTRATDGVVGGINFDTNDQFCLDGQRLILVSGRHGAYNSQYKTEIDSYSTITVKQSSGTGLPTKFEVITKAGEIMQYGFTSDSKIGPSSSKILSWGINKLSDKKSNYVDYKYQKINGTTIKDEQVPLSIHYTGNTALGQDPFASIVFNYAENNRPKKSYVAGFEIASTQLLKDIEVRLGANRIRKYELTYKNSFSYNLLQQKRLQSVQECAGANADKCLPETYFVWDGAHTSNIDFVGSGANNIARKSGTINANPDGSTSLPAQFYSPDDDFFAGKDAGIPTFAISNKFDTFGWGTDATRTKWDYEHSDKLIGDVNGDGLSDIVGITFAKDDGSSRRHREFEVALSTGTRFVTGAFDTSRLGAGGTDSEGSTKKYPYYLADVNGDGLSDLISFNFSDVTVALSDGKAFIPKGTWHAGDFNYGQWRETHGATRFVQDVNGDGKADLVGVNNAGVYVALSNGINKFEFGTSKAWIADFKSSSTNLFPYWNYHKENLDTRLELADVNGDGLPDIIGMHPNIGVSVAINTATGFSSRQVWNSETTDEYNPILLGDINGDGLTDLVKFGGLYSGYAKVSYSTGIGFTNFESVFEDISLKGSIKQVPKHLLDVNGDGLSDIVMFSSIGLNVALSTGSGFKYVNFQPEWAAEFGTYPSDTVFCYQCQLPVKKWDTKKDIRTFGDFNGDGLLDIIGINGGGVLVGENKTEPQRITRIVSGGVVADPSIHDGLNRSIDILYDKLTSPLSTSPYRADISATQKGLRPALFVVAKHYSSNGEITGEQERQAAMSYFYKGFDVDRTTYRGSLGFAERTVTDGISDISTTSSYYQRYPYIGSVKNVVTKDKNGVTISSSGNSYLSRQASPKVLRVHLASSNETSYNNSTGTAYKKTQTTNGYPDTCGNTGYVETTIYNLEKEGFYVEDYHADPYLVNHNSKKVTSSTYPQSGDCFARSRLIKSTVTSTSTETDAGTQSRTSSFTYTSEGQIKTETIQPGHDLALTTTYGYDAYGNINHKTVSGSGINPKITTFDYTGAAKGRYPLVTTRIVSDGADQTTLQHYDDRFGTVTHVTDANGLTSSSQYNAFGQKYLQTSATGEKTHIAYNWCKNITIHHSEARYCTTTTSQSGGYSKTYYDQIDRVLRTESIGLGKGSGSTIVYKDKQYNLTTGQLVAESRPYYSDETAEWTTYTYDALERPKTITQPTGLESSVSYDGLTTTKIDVNGKRTQQTLTAEGKTAQVTDALDNTIDYSYFADGNLRQTGVTASTSGGQTAAETPTSITTFSYDTLGNKTGMIDPDMGTWSYTYDPTGALQSQTNANGQTTTMTYDNLGRIKTRVEAEGTHRWYYDSASGKGIGKLHRITSPGNYKKSFTYTSDYGQVASVTEQLPASINSTATTAYTTRTSYDTFGRVATLTYPQADHFNPVIVKHHYTRGALTRISNQAETLNYWEAQQADANGSLTSEKLGNGVTTTKNYDALGRITQIYSGKTNSGSDLQQLTYGFDGAGNLTWRDDNNQLKENFEYDDLYRLKRIQSTYAGQVIPGNTHRYDGHGNITEKDGIHYSYKTGGDKGGVHAVSQVGNQDYRYDSNGNLLSGSGKSYTWTSFDKPAQIIGADGNIRLTYNSERQRILKDGNKETTWYIGGGYERVKKKANNAEIHKYYLSAGGKTVAYITQHKNSNSQWVAQNTRYLLKDHLGSTQMVLDNKGQSLEQLSFSAWGKRRGGGPLLGTLDLSTILAGIERTAIKLGFTGHEHDYEVGLVNMKGRLYDATTGRFISADPHIQAAGDTQSFNRYTYVKNNPLSYTDPSGYFFKKLFRSLKKFFKKYGRTILAIAVGVLTAGAALYAYAGTAAFGLQTLSAIYAANGLGAALIGGAIAGGAGAFASTLVATGSIKDALTAGVFGALSGALAFGIGHGGFIGGGKAGIAVAHGVAQGTVSVLRGGKFKSGFAGGFFGHMAGGTFKGKNVYTRTAFSAAVGGTISKAVGGKFANGAVSAAFTHLFNSEVALGSSLKPINWGQIGSRLWGGLRGLSVAVGRSVLGIFSVAIPSTMGDSTSIIMYHYSPVSKLIGRLGAGQYVTPNGGMSSGMAIQQLALDKPLGIQLYIHPVPGTSSDFIAAPNSLSGNVVAPANGQLGGGTEFITTRSILTLPAYPAPSL